MKRDLDLVRSMLLAIEDHPQGYAPKLMVEECTAEQVDYHSYLLIDAGLAKGNVWATMGSTGPKAQITQLTWAGHEFAEAARDDTRWKKAMGIVKDKGGSVTMDVLKDLLTSLMKAAIGLS